MKKTMFAGLLSLMLPHCAAAQDEQRSLLHEKLNGKINYSYFRAEPGYSYMALKNKDAHGIDINLGAVLNHFFVTGISFNYHTAKDLHLPSVPVINPIYEYIFASWNNELLIRPKGIIYSSVQLRTGVGQVTYSDKAERTNYYYYDPNMGLYHQMPAPKVVADDSFFLLEPGANMGINITKVIGVKLGAHYRFAWGVDKAGTNEEFSRYSFAASLSFRLDHRK
jgi:hypothetical protein